MSRSAVNPLPNVVAVTLNPAIDQSVVVDELRPGQVHRVRASRRQAGGKGLNVATMLSLGGQAATVSGFLGLENAELFEAHFSRHRLEDAFVRVPGETRTCIKILDSLAGTTDLNFPGVRVEAEHIAALCDRLLELAGAGVWFVVSGSMPRGFSVDEFIGLLRRLRETGVKIAVDSSGSALRSAIELGVDLIKPNEHEFAEALGLADARPETVMAAVDSLEIDTVILSMGREGALFASGGGKVLAKAPRLEVVSTVAAGDALLAGYLSGELRGLSLEDRARTATAYAWSRLVSLEPHLPGAQLMQERLSSVELECL